MGQSLAANRCPAWSFGRGVSPLYIVVFSPEIPSKPNTLRESGSYAETGTVKLGLIFPQI